MQDVWFRNDRKQNCPVNGSFSGQQGKYPFFTFVERHFYPRAAGFFSMAGNGPP